LKQKKKYQKVNTKLMTVFVMQYFNPRQNIVVPNVFWGMGFGHEVDVLVCSKLGYTTEVEIKISRGDLLADFRKKHDHSDPKINSHYFAVPEYLEDLAREYLRPGWGLLVLKHRRAYIPDCHSKKVSDEIVDCGTRYVVHGYEIKKVVNAKKKFRQPGFSSTDMNELNRLGCLRIADLYRENYKLRKKFIETTQELFDWV